MRSTRLFVVLTALALLAAACGGDDAETTTTTAATTTTTSTTVPPTTSSTASTTTTSSTTTTTEPIGPVEPLNGLPVENDELIDPDDELVDRRVIAVKIDNHPNARPQSGLELADGVFEILVEGGLTRFVALFHTTDVDYVGPIRSGRPTDPTVLNPMGATFVLSGAQPWVSSLIAARGVNMIGEVAGTYRMSHRYAPHNLYGDTNRLRETADGRGYPDEFGLPVYDIAGWEEPPTETAETIQLSWAPGNLVIWQYDDGEYLRFLGTSAHNWVDREGETGQLSAEVLVVIVGTKYTASPPAGRKGSSVPATDLTGSGAAYVFHQGTVMEGTWERESYEEPFELKDADGEPMTVPPGRPWVSFFLANRTISWT